MFSTFGPVLRMTIGLVLVTVAIILLGEKIAAAFVTNPVINGIILGAFIIGAAQIFISVISLNSDVRWLQAFHKVQSGQTSLTKVPSKPKLLAATSSILNQKLSEGNGLDLSPEVMQTLLDGVGSRLEERRETTRYFIGLLVFLGLLGTFWGLLDTVRGVSGVISGLQISGQNFSQSFEGLKEGLRVPLNGMGAAFGSSLLGLGGSLILGFLGLQSGQAQNRFYNYIEEWLSDYTRISNRSAGSYGGMQSNSQTFLEAFVPELIDEIRGLKAAIGSEQGTEAEIGQSLKQMELTLQDLLEDQRRLALQQNELLSQTERGISRLVQFHENDKKLQDIHNSVRELSDVQKRGVESILRQHHEASNVQIQELRTVGRIISRATDQTQL